jgi:hypothetical protein
MNPCSQSLQLEVRATTLQPTNRPFLNQKEIYGCELVVNMQNNMK